MKVGLRPLSLGSASAAALILAACAYAPLADWQQDGSSHDAVFRPARPIEGATGLASYYHPATRNADVLTAAHRTLPFGTRVRVTNLSNNRTITVEITDRGPFIANRLIDLSYGAATAIGMTEFGVVPVRLDVLP